MIKSTEFAAWRRTLLVAVAAAGLGTTAAASEGAFEVTTAEQEVYGTRAVEAGDFDAGIDKLLKALAIAGDLRSMRAPVLVNLCAAYTAKRDFSNARNYCDEAVSNGWLLGVAYNNRAVLSVVTGNYGLALEDFRESIRNRGAVAVASRNVTRTEARLAALSREPEARLAGVTIEVRNPG